VVEEDILAALTGSPPATSAGDNVYALVLPDGTDYPALTYQRISTVPVNSLAGSSGLDQVRVQIDCWAATYGAAKALADEVRPVMEAAAFKGLLVTDTDDYDEVTRLYRISMDFYCWQKE
jgi:hypothetical protein